jgi:hypothetical protein
MDLSGLTPSRYIVCEYYPADNVLEQFTYNVLEQLPDDEVPSASDAPTATGQPTPTATAQGAASTAQSNTPALWIALAIAFMVII